MKKVDLYGGGSMVPVCDECLKGNHNTHLPGKSNILGCNEVEKEGHTITQCCCGVGGDVFKG